MGRTKGATAKRRPYITLSHSPVEILERIQTALEAAVAAIAPFITVPVRADEKSAGRGPVTEADRAADRVLLKALLRDGEGWLSEETVDDLVRLEKRHVWVVDPLDGTLEFVAGIPEWCVSVAFVENGRVVAGGILNPLTKETFLGHVEHGITYNGKPSQVGQTKDLNGALVLASRSEVRRGEWRPFENEPFQIRPMGSVAYKLARVAAGLADATWTLTPKNEWDVAAGAALVQAAGGFVRSLSSPDLAFNNKSSLLPGFVAAGPYLKEPILSLLRTHAQP